MKGLRNLLFVLILVSCNATSQEEKIIKVFNDTFGEKNTQALDEIVVHGENLLMKTFNVSNANEAYGQFLTYIANVRIDSLDIGLTDAEAKSFVELFEKDNFKYYVFDFTLRNGYEAFEMDKVGLFMETLKQLEPYSEIATDYYESTMITGTIPYFSLANGILDRYIEYDEYVLKRIFIVDILYRHCTLILLKNVS